MAAVRRSHSTVSNGSATSSGQKRASIASPVDRTSRTDRRVLGAVELIDFADKGLGATPSANGCHEF